MHLVARVAARGVLARATPDDIVALLEITAIEEIGARIAVEHIPTVVPEDVVVSVEPADDIVSAPAVQVIAPIRR